MSRYVNNVLKSVASPSASQSSSKAAAMSARGLEALGLMTGSGDADTKQKQQTMAATKATIKWLKQRDSFKFKKISIYCRPVSGVSQSSSSKKNDDEKESPMEVFCGVNGIVHTMVVMTADGMDYFVDKVTHGIRVRAMMTPDDSELNKSSTYKVKSTNVTYLNFTSKQFIDVIESEMKIPYDVMSQNCIHFAQAVYKKATGATITQDMLGKWWKAASS